MRRTSAIAAAILLSITLSLPAQTVFEVISVKPNVSADGPSDPRKSPGRLSWSNVTLRQLIQVAYDVRPYQLIALPDWADSARFDVAATASFPASPQQMNTMLQSLLADRFDLAVHREKRELPVYALVLARRDARLGPGIHAATVDCEAIGTRPLDSGPAQADYAGCAPQMGLTRLKASGFRMSSLASGLMRILDRTVIDKTGLTGTFDIELSWTPEPTMLPNGAPAPASLPGAGPSIFTALEEQLGLKLVSDRGPVDVLVIDRLNRLKPD
jgi:uncharacterized protein (TIGR03435 family)